MQVVDQISSLTGKKGSGENSPAHSDTTNIGPPEAPVPPTGEGSSTETSGGSKPPTPPATTGPPTVV
jgi:hypothetical protein